MVEQTNTSRTVVGNEALLTRLERDIRGGNLSHAYILDGPSGSGRHTIARHICASLACYNRPGRTAPEEDTDQIGFFDALMPKTVAPRDPNAPLPCGSCAACEKVYGGICPDVHIIGRGNKASIGVDAIRFLRSDVLIAPNDMDTKIYIIEDAETMTVQAQNALLLTLEEPPPYVLFLLLCNGSDALLETIRSRAPILRTRPVSDEEIRSFLQTQKKSLPEAELRAVLLNANGCIGQALTLADPKAVKPLLKLRGLADAFVESCINKSADGILAAVSQFGNKRDTVSEVLTYVSAALRDLLLLKNAENVRLKYYTDQETATELSMRVGAHALLTVYDAVNTACEALSRNGNVRLILTQLCVDAGVL